MQVSRCVAGIDVHKKMLAVVVENAGTKSAVGTCEVCTTAKDLELMHAWLQTHAVEEVVMESTGQYHKPVWLQLGGNFDCTWHSPIRIEDRRAGRETFPMQCE